MSKLVYSIVRCPVCGCYTGICEGGAMTGALYSCRNCGTRVGFETVANFTSESEFHTALSALCAKYDSECGGDGDCCTVRIVIPDLPDGFEPLFGSEGVMDGRLDEDDAADDGGDGTGAYTFMLATSPFGVCIEANDPEEARTWLLAHLKEAMLSGFSDAVKRGMVDVHVIPSTGDAYACRAEDVSGDGE